jgi:glycerol-3-phosphate dehydrogenase
MTAAPIPWPEAPEPRRDDAPPQRIETQVGIIGAGIHGAALARELTLRGVPCALLDRGGVGGGTSQWSSQLLHGGIRYMLTGDFQQMREGLAERAAWMRIAPHRCRWEAFWMPHHHLLEGLAHDFGIGFYDHWGRERPGWPEELHLGSVPDRVFRADPRAAATPFRGATAYADLLTADRALTRDLAASSDAVLLDFHQVLGWESEARILATAILKDHRDGRERRLSAEQWVFALGPWTDRAVKGWFGEDSRRLRLSAGVHLWFDPIPGCERPWAIRRPAGRVLFVIPRDGLLQVGTTEREVDDGWAPVQEEEIEELLEALEECIPALPWRTMPMRASESGVRPLVRGAGDTARLSREAVLEIHPAYSNLRLVLGGKLTSARALMATLATDLTGRPCEASAHQPLQPWDGQAPRIR